MACLIKAHVHLPLNNRKLAYWLAVAMLTTACGTYNISVRAFYHLGTDKYKRVEGALINLYKNGIFKTNADTLNWLIARSIPGYTEQAIPNEWSADGYRKYDLDLGAGVLQKQDFVVYYPKNRHFYYLEITNCGSAFGCDIFVNRIIGQNLVTGSQVVVSWEKAGPALQDFEDNLLPAIRRSLAAAPK